MKQELIPTPEQETIIQKSATGIDLMLEARAGSAKTTTLTMLGRQPHFASKNGLCLAFNKAIAEEMATRMPENFECKTLNGLGYRIWRDFKGGGKLDKGKVYRLLRAEIESISDLEQKQEHYENLQVLLEACRMSKVNGYVYGATNPIVRPLMDEETFFEEFRYDLSLEERRIVNRVTNLSLKEMLEQSILDFDDMIFGPAICKILFPSYDCVFVDEAQDLSPINHVMVKKLKKRNTQLIAVGDPFPAIDGFRGADTASMDSLRNMFELETCYLTVSFRCAENIIREAQWRAPDMKWPEWAGAGQIKHMSEWGEQHIPDNAVIICRNNAPLLSLALKLIRDGRYPEIVGRDILAGLIKVMEKQLGKKTQSRDQVLDSLELWKEKEQRRCKDSRLVGDRYECIKIFIEQTKTLTEAIDLAKALSSRGGRIKLMTGHKSKGLEFDTVFFLDQHLCRTAENPQDANLKYVIQTRAKNTLIYVESENYETKEPENGH